MAELRWGLATHEGNVRPQNEDNAFADGRLFVVADGMGGHLAGEVASEMVVTRLHETFSAEATGVYNEDSAESDNETTAVTTAAGAASSEAATEADGESDTPTATSGNGSTNAGDNKTEEIRSTTMRVELGRDDLVTAVAIANTEIFDESAANPDRAGMGTTVTAIAVVDDRIDDEVFAVANVGDSRIYRVRHQRLRQVTIDHSFVQELVAEGAITREEARTHPRRNIVTRALGIESDVRVDSWTLPIVRGDRYVLCSDGLVDEVADDDIAAILIANPDPQDAAERCVEAALDNGGRDNVTVVVVDVLSGLEPPEPTDEIEAIPAWGDGHDDMPTGEVPIITDDLVLEDVETAPEGSPADTPKVAPATTATSDAAAAAPETTPAGGTPIPTMSRVEANRAAAAARANAKPPRRQLGASRFILIVGVAAVVILAVVVLSAWARSGYVIAFNDSDRVALYQGKDFLWFHPTEVGPYPPRRDELTSTAISLVERRPEFGSRASANGWAAEYLQTTTTTTMVVVVATAPVAAPAAPAPPLDSVPPAPPVNTTSPPTTTSTSGP